MSERFTGQSNNSYTQFAHHASQIFVWTSQICVRASQTSPVVKSPIDVPPSNELSPSPGPDATPAGPAVDPGPGSVPSPCPGSVPAAVTELFSSSGDGSGT